MPEETIDWAAPFKRSPVTPRYLVGGMIAEVAGLISTLPEHDFRWLSPQLTEAVELFDREEPALYTIVAMELLRIATEANTALDLL